MKDNLLEIKNRSSVSSISKEDMAKINKKISEEMDEAKKGIESKRNRFNIISI